jgi:hypothetical protein
MNQRTISGWQIALIAMAGVIILAVGIASDGILGIVCGAMVLVSVPFTWRSRSRAG